jgi:hypothetical protein
LEETIRRKLNESKGDASESVIYLKQDIDPANMQEMTGECE